MEEFQKGSIDYGISICTARIEPTNNAYLNPISMIPCQLSVPNLANVVLDHIQQNNRKIITCSKKLQTLQPSLIM